MNRKQLKKHAEFVFVTSPVAVPPIDDVQDKDGGCGWWFSRPDDYFKAQDESDCIKGFEVRNKCSLWQYLVLLSLNVKLLSCPAQTSYLTGQQMAYQTSKFKVTTISPYWSLFH